MIEREVKEQLSLQNNAFLSSKLIPSTPRALADCPRPAVKGLLRKLSRGVTKLRMLRISYIIPRALPRRNCKRFLAEKIFWSSRYIFVLAMVS